MHRALELVYLTFLHVSPRRKPSVRISLNHVSLNYYVMAFHVVD